jgi:hypothetical protein
MCKMKGDGKPTRDWLEAQGHIAEYGIVYCYAKNLSSLSYLFKAFGDSITKDGMGRFIEQDNKIDLTVRHYCVHNDHELDECDTAGKERRRRCKEENEKCTHFWFRPYPEGPEIPNEPYHSGESHEKPTRARL